MKVGILGTRGIPNAYGGFEQFAEYLSLGLLRKGAEVWVYNSHNHPYRDNNWNGINIIHCYDPENKIGTPGQFIYDLNCILDSRKRNFDILLQLGYTSSAVWNKLLPRKPAIVTNMDGLEWKRSKYSRTVRSFLRRAEKMAVNSSHLLVADSEVIRDYLLETYQQKSVFIPYGADIIDKPGDDKLKLYAVEPNAYFLLIARLQPDNHIEEIIQGVMDSKSGLPLLLVGNTKNKFGEYLLKKYNTAQTKFLGGIFDNGLLNQLRYHSKIYFHGHSAGGTNPSLLEAMAASAFICAHDNLFNKSVLKENALFFKTPDDIAKYISDGADKSRYKDFIQHNLKRLEDLYNWDHVINHYYQAFYKLVEKKS